jgi:hypothetical protein
MKTPKLALIPIMAIGLASVITLSGCSDDPEFNRKLGLALSEIASETAKNYEKQQEQREEDQRIRNIVNQELNAYDRQRVSNQNMYDIQRNMLGTYNSTTGSYDKN